MRHIFATASLVAVMSFNAAAQQPARTVPSVSRPAPAALRTAPAPRTTAPTSTGATRSIDPRSLPGTRSVGSTIQGNALDSSGGALPETTVRLRDARSGRIADTQVTDNSGMFTFQAVDPGSYIVEIIGNDHTILAASQMLSINAGDTLLAVVKLPFRISPFAGLLGHNAATASAITAIAGSAQVLAVKATQCVSPEPGCGK